MSRFLHKTFFIYGIIKSSVILSLGNISAENNKTGETKIAIYY